MHSMPGLRHFITPGGVGKSAEGAARAAGPHLALRLGDVAVQRTRADDLAQAPRQLVGVVLGLSEDDGAAAYTCRRHAAGEQAGKSGSLAASLMFPWGWVATGRPVPTWRGGCSANLSCCGDADNPAAPRGPHRST